MLRFFYQQMNLLFNIQNIKIYIKTLLYSHSYMFRSVQSINRESILYKKSNFGQAQYRLPDDGLHGPKHVGVTVKKCFNVNFNTLYVK
jgi:hypothetical protein